MPGDEKAKRRLHAMETRATARELRQTPRDRVNLLSFFPRVNVTTGVFEAFVLIFFGV